jgi:small conductance mechanosensitive channel
MLIVLIRLPDVLDPLTEKLSSWWEGLLRMLPNIVVAFIIVLVFVFLARGLAKLTSKALGAWSTHMALHQLIVTSVRVSVIILGMFIALGVLELDKTVTSLLAGVGVVGLALGFAFQDIAANFMSGVIMGFRQPLAIGDEIEVKGVSGIVRELNLRATMIETFQGQLAVVPNKDVLQNVLTNFTELGRRRIDLEVGVAYDSDLDEVERVTRDALESLQERARAQPVRVFFTSFDESSINLVAHVWIDLGEQSFLQTRSEAVKAISKAYAAAGIAIPFPIRTLDFGADLVGGKRLEAALGG